MGLGGRSEAGSSHAESWYHGTSQNFLIAIEKKVTSLGKYFSSPGLRVISGAPEGSDAFAIAELLAEKPQQNLVYVARDDVRMTAMAEALTFFSLNERILQFPAWDCLPYDRISPKSEVIARRLRTLMDLIKYSLTETKTVLVTTCNAALQRVPTSATLETCHFSLHVSRTIDIEALTTYFKCNGYHRSGTVMEPGEYALRGGIIDIYPSNSDSPVRIDLFGDVVESIRTFDPLCSDFRRLLYLNLIDTES